MNFDKPDPRNCTKSLHIVKRVRYAESNHKPEILAWCGIWLTDPAQTTFFKGVAGVCGQCIRRLERSRP